MTAGTQTGLRAEAGPRPRVGLVLGGGGVVGQAYHAGALAALEHDLGWDPRTAAVIVGTSAGSLAGHALRSGVPAGGLAAWAVDAPLWGRTAELAASAGPRPEFPPMRLLDLVRPGRLPGPRMLTRAARAPWRIRPTTLALVLARAGSHRLDDHLEMLAALPTAWPEAPLWVTAVRRADGARVVFGHEGAPGASPAAALAASCAVPGYFAPARIEGVDYVDGGTHSPTNADLLRRSDVDLVVVISPMSAGSAPGWALHGGVRRFAGRRLHREVGGLLASGRSVLVLQPRRDVLRAMGSDLMAGAVVTDVVREAFLDTGAQLREADGGVRALLGAPDDDRGALAAPA